MFYRGAKKYIMQQREEIGLFTSSVKWAVWVKDEYSTRHTRQKSNFDRLLHIIFFITQIREETWSFAKKIMKKKNLKKNFGNKFWKNIVQKKIEKKIIRTFISATLFLPC